jgi:hypothetical protein
MTDAKDLTLDKPTETKPEVKVPPSVTKITEVKPSTPVKNDGKFFGKIQKLKDSKEVPMDEVIIFGLWDQALVPTLRKYLQFCKMYGCKLDQLEAIAKLIVKAEAWQTAHPTRVKPADMP